MLEQRCLSDPRLAAKNEHPTLSGSHAREQIVEDLALSSPSAQRGLHHLSNGQVRCSSFQSPASTSVAAREQTRGFHGCDEQTR
jgi:hypothetical protein